MQKFSAYALAGVTGYILFSSGLGLLWTVLTALALGHFVFDPLIGRGIIAYHEMGAVGHVRKPVEHR